MLKPIEVDQIVSPCKGCKKNKAVTCREWCLKLELFNDQLQSNQDIGFGITDTDDGYNFDC